MVFNMDGAVREREKRKGLFKRVYLKEILGLIVVRWPFAGQGGRQPG